MVDCRGENYGSQDSGRCGGQGRPDNDRRDAASPDLIAAQRQLGQILASIHLHVIEVDERSTAEERSSYVETCRKSALRDHTSLYSSSWLFHFTRTLPLTPPRLTGRTLVAVPTTIKRSTIQFI